MRTRRVTGVCGVVALAFWSGGGMAQDRPPLTEAQVATAVEALDADVARIMELSGVPGVAVAVVHDGETILARGYGVRELGQPGEIAPDTVFQIASLSKSLSATVVARQVGHDGVAWTTPVQQLMPSFELSDPWVGAHVTIGDMFAHRSGLPEHAGDPLEDLGYDRAEVLARLRVLPLAPFRTSYAYTNFGLTAAAEAVAEAAGSDWATLSETALFAPLGMTDTSARLSDFLARDDRAIGHTLIGGEFVPYRTRQPDAQAPAGGVSSTVEDFARWMAMVLEGGEVDGEPFLTSAQLVPAITAQVISRPAPGPDALPEFYGYGFGVGQSPSGRMTLSHSGAFLLGAATRYVMLPETGLGIVVFTNGTPVGAPEAIARNFIDRAEFGAPLRDWWSLFSGGFEPMCAPVGALAGQTPPDPPEPAADLTAYAGTYANPYFGPARVEVTGDGLTLALGPRDVFALSHWSGDTFTYQVLNENMPDGSMAAVRFADPADGGARSLEIDYLDENGQGTFHR